MVSEHTMYPGLHLPSIYLFLLFFYTPSPALFLVDRIKSDAIESNGVSNRSTNVKRATFFRDKGINSFYAVIIWWPYAASDISGGLFEGIQCVNYLFDRGKTDLCLITSSCQSLYESKENIYFFFIMLSKLLLNLWIYLFIFYRKLRESWNLLRT